jgi:hypothetical protein
VRFDWESESFCDPGAEGLCEISGFKYTVSWKAPRTKGVEIGIYGITTCFDKGNDGAVIDGWCLREHTELQKSELALLAKAPASKGTVTWRMNEPGYLDGTMKGDAYYPGDRFYSVVLAANDGRNSVLAIADVTHVCNLIESMECPDDSIWPPGDGE